MLFLTNSDSPDWDLSVASLDSLGDEQGKHHLTGTGAIRGADFNLSGEFGSLEGLVNLTSVDHDLELRLGETQLTSSGSVADLSSLTGIDLRANATIPQPAEITTLLGLPATQIRSLDLEADAVSTSGLTDFTVTVGGEAADLRAEGTVDSLIAPADLDLDVQFEGPDIQPVGALVGIPDLEHESFDVAGHLAWKGFPVEITGLDMRVGENRVTADGRLGAPPLMLGTDFQIKGKGPDAAAVVALAGIRLPHDSFEIEGRLFRVENGLQIEAVKAAIGSANLSTSGFIGDPPDYTGTELTIEAGGPKLVHFNRLLGITAPAEPFHFKGRLAQGDRAIELHGVEATLGPAHLGIDGRLTTVERMIGTDLELKTGGRDLSQIGDLFGFDRLPAFPFLAEGRLRVTTGGFRLTDVTGRIAETDLSGHGLVTRRKHLVGTGLEVEAEGKTLRVLADLVPSMSLPNEAFGVKGGLELEENGLVFQQVEFQIGGTTGALEGRLGTGPHLDGTDLRIEAKGPSLAVVDSLIPSFDLPPVRFSVAGGVTVNEGIIGLRDLAIELADNTATIDGHVVPSTGLNGTSVRASIDGPNLDDLGTLVENAISKDLPTLPVKRFSLAGEITIDEAGHHLPALSLSLGEATSTITGFVGRPPEFIGSDIEIRAEGPDASLIVVAMGADAAAAPFRIGGRISKEPSGLLFDDFNARIGEYSADVDGRLGKLPKLIGTSLSVHAAGPDLELLRQILEIDYLPSQPFEATGHFEGDPRRFKTNALEISFGSSDLSGDLRIEFEDKPSFTARLASNRVKVSDLLPERERSQEETDQDPIGVPPTDEVYKVSDEPWNLTALELVDVDLDWDIGSLEYIRSTDRDVELSFELADGRLVVDRFRGTGELGGTVDGSATLAPDEKGHKLGIEFHTDNTMINFAGENADPDQYTPVDFHLSMDAVGRSSHEVMANADGRALITIEGGVMEKGIIDMVSADFLVTLLEALNPFAKQDTHTTLNCAVLAATFEDGVMTLDPAAIQTSKVTILGDGVIDYNTEKLRLDWITKPRKGIGISASMFTNPYIRLGGTLANPKIEMKPAEALATTGVAVATMGISLVAKGLFDRVTAEKKVCAKAMKQVAKMDAGAPRK